MAYGTTQIYFVLKNPVMKEFDEMVINNKIDAKQGFALKFRCNNLTDIKRKNGKLYFYVKEILDMQDTIKELNDEMY
ncbi:hypothetical protein [Mediterraneibacter agrestimuris]|uniref:hypothetical protein n=1 Tax=Mediterraneibacter agrestimuris TaxID=2941333 RepID=UPI0020414102|nr:hypothetical protein [Mediterraneibacter agrestimuris]